MSRKRKSTDKEPPANTSTSQHRTASRHPKYRRRHLFSFTSFAERVGERKGITTPDPFSIAKDYLAGVRLFESKQDRQMAIKFGDGRPEDKPSQAVIGKMKEAGFRWNPADRIWSIRSGRRRLEHPHWGREALPGSTPDDPAGKGIDPGQDIPF